MFDPTQLSPLSSSYARPAARIVPSASVVRASRPRGFKSLKGILRNVRFGNPTDVPHNKGRTYAQKAGLRYEQKIHDVLSSIYDDNYCVAPAILFEDGTGFRRAIPDGLLQFGRTIVIVEIKLTHTERAYWQLVRLYRPLVAHLMPGTHIACVEICRSYDPAVTFPEPHDVTTSLHKLTERVGVLTWKL